MRARERRVELDRALRRLLRLVVAAHVAEHEAEQVVRVGIVRRELDRALERVQRLIVEAAIVQHLADVELVTALAGHRARARAQNQHCASRDRRSPSRRAPAARSRRRRSAVLQHRAELRRRPSVAWPSNAYVRPSSQRASRSSGCDAQPVAQLGDAPIVVAGVKVRDLEVALRDLHLRVELERARRTRRPPPRTSPCCSTGRRGCCARRRRSHRCAARTTAECRDRAARSGVADEPFDVTATRTARRITCSDAASGSSRKNPRSSSPSPCRKNCSRRRTPCRDRAELQIRRRQHRRRHVHGETRRRRKQHESHEIAQRVHVGAAQNVAGLLDRRLLELAEGASGSVRPTQHELREPDRRGDAGTRAACAP